MKRILLLMAILALTMFLAATLMACGDGETTSLEGSDTSSATTSLDSMPGTTSTVDTSDVPVYEDLVIIEDGKTDYQVIFPYKADKDGTYSKVLVELRKAFASYGLPLIAITNDRIPTDEKDTFVAPEYEILLGNTKHEESVIPADLAFNEAVIRVVGKKVVIGGNHDLVTAMAVLEFIDKYMSKGGTTVTLPGDLNEVFTVDLTDCLATGMNYADMATYVSDSFNNVYWNEDGWVDGGRFWTGAEMLEIYADIYEATGKEEDKEKLLSFINQFKDEWGHGWQFLVMNDDIMWGSIAFTRTALLTGEEKWGFYAKMNFDMAFKRAWSDDFGGGLWWRSEKDSKNSCVNCPGAIAACLLGELYNDESYYEKAKQIMDWEIKTLFNAKTGQVYDAIYADGKNTIGEYRSTYNQGTFVGACTLLYKHYKDETYLKYAQKAVDHAIQQLGSYGILNCEGDLASADLPGFKGILTRWFYRYAKEVESIEVLSFLQNNAASAYQNRNKDGLIWTTWANKTPDSATTDPDNYIIWGLSPAVALMYNCQQWW